jgi:hypothetical protein
MFDKKHFPEIIVQMSGENNYMFGREHSEESRKKKNYKNVGC